MPPEASFVQILVQGGAVGVALAALWLVHRVVTNHANHTDGIIEKNTDAYASMVASNTKLCGSIDSLEKTVQSKL